MAKRQLAATMTKDELKARIAKNLKTARTQHAPDMTQAKVAELFNPPLTRAAIQQWEVGDTLPDLDRVAVLSKAFGVTIDSLVFGEDEVKGDLTLEGRKAGRLWETLQEKHRVLSIQMMRALQEADKADKSNRR